MFTSLLVRALKQLKDVILSSPKEGDVLTYHNNKWRNIQPVASSNGTVQEDYIIEAGATIFDKVRNTRINQVTYNDNALIIHHGRDSFPVAMYVCRKVNEKWEVVTTPMIFTENRAIVHNYVSLVGTGVSRIFLAFGG